MSNHLTTKQANDATSHREPHNVTESPDWKLTVIEGPDSGHQFDARNGDTIVVGRGADSDTQIQDPRLSRVHCEVVFNDQGSTVVDRNGSGGTFVDGQQVEDSVSVSHGAILSIGESKLRIVQTRCMDQDTVAPSSDASADDEPSLKRVNVSSLAGKTLQNYRLDKLISTSANSVVYQGLDTENDERVAIKILKPQMVTTDVQRDRFVRAMRTMLPVKHPNIVRIRKAGRTGPVCWTALDWIDGTSVATLIEQIGISGMLNWKEVWRVAVHVGRALHEANKLEIVHRNVTPTNIIRRDSDKSFLLTDLIFARALEQTDAQQLTRPGDIVGDLGYMAPERIYDSTYLDARSDQYSLGATLYALLTGRPPYVATSLVDLIEQLRTSTPPPAADAQIGMDERFSDLVMKLLGKTPESRFISAIDMLKDLERVGKLGGIEADWSAWVD